MKKRFTDWSPAYKSLQGSPKIRYVLDSVMVIGK